MKKIAIVLVSAIWLLAYKSFATYERKPITIFHNGNDCLATARFLNQYRTDPYSLYVCIRIENGNIYGEEW